MTTMTEAFSPFGTLGEDLVGDPPTPAATTTESPAEPSRAPLTSPFGPLFTHELATGEAQEWRDTAQELLTELEDEDFADSLEALVDEAAARHTVDLTSWSTAPAPAEARAMLEAWLEPLASEAERSLDALSEQLSSLDPATVSEAELEDMLDRVGEVPVMGNEVFEQFLGGLISKVKSFAKGAVNVVKKGIAAVGKILPIGVLLDRLKGLVRSLLRGVLQTAISRLPSGVQPIARTVAAKLGIAEAEAAAPVDDQETSSPAMLAEAFDAQLVGLLSSDTGEAEADEAEAEAEADRTADAQRELDDARARLAGQLADLGPGESAAPPVQQFLPVLLAARPLIRMAITVIGRDRVINFVADKIALLIQGLVGQDAARQLARPLVDLGFKALGFEAPPAPTLAGEALAATVEGTMERLMDLPAEAFADELQLESALQSAFAEAAAAAIPDRFLREDLPEREVAAGGSGVWVLMPRAARPHYRYRRYSRVFVVPVTRQVARAVPWTDGGTLETYLLDRGVRSWPAPAEIRVYETLPGAELGHLAQGEAGETLSGPVSEQAQEFQPLTPEIAGLLVGEPGLGRRMSPAARWAGHYPAFRYPAFRGGYPISPAVHHRPVPGRRYVHVRPVAGPVGLRPRVRRPRRRVGFAIVLSGSSPQVRVRVRLSERQGQELAAKLAPAVSGKPDPAAALAMLKEIYAATLPARIVNRLIRRGLEPDATKAAAVADKVVAGVTSALSTALQERPHLIASAAQDPADGITVTITFRGVTKESLDNPLPAGTVEVTPGWSLP
ncbi:MAG: hypothetical protein ACM3ML_14785 [Micromonosporaceae bacterium]